MLKNRMLYSEEYSQEYKNGFQVRIYTGDGEMGFVSITSPGNFIEKYQETCDLLCKDIKEALDRIFEKERLKGEQK